jgi:hypothetical protein
MQTHLRQYLCTLYQSCTAASKAEISQNLVEYLYFFSKETAIVEINIHACDHNGMTALVIV